MTEVNKCFDKSLAPGKRENLNCNGITVGGMGCEEKKV